MTTHPSTTPPAFEVIANGEPSDAAIAALARLLLAVLDDGQTDEQANNQAAAGGA